MRIRMIALLALCLLAANFIADNQAGLQSASQTTTAESQLSKLPSELREKGRQLLNQSEELRRANLVKELFRTDRAATIEFLLAVLETDPSARVRAAILDEVKRFPHPQVRQALERHAASDADAKVAIMALETLRYQDNFALAGLLKQRLEMARRSGDEQQYRLLAKEQERWISLVGGTMLPTFMQTPPPLFSLKVASQLIRVLAFGDFGIGTSAQKEVAEAMLKFHRRTPFDFAITLGDNFYPKGMESPSDPRWKTWWEEMYSPLGIHFYASLGNHDWGLGDSPAAEVLYTQRSPSWRMPATYYTFTAGPAQFFALDTNEISAAQLLWLEDELKKSQARWKIVYGHHPGYSEGQHRDNPRIIKELLPVLRDRADIYLAGHDHDMQHLKPEGKLHFFVTGSGGQLRPITPGPRSLFAKSARGFAVLEADANQVRVKFIDTNVNQLYEYTLRRQGATNTTSAARPG